MKKLSILVFVLALASLAWAVPARQRAIDVVQPDGSTLTLYPHGDERFHWFTNEQGQWMTLGQDGFYHVTEALTSQQIDKRIATSKRATQAAYPLNIAPRGLVILVNFADLAFETSKAEMDSMLTGQDYQRHYSYTYRGKTYNIQSQGSARQYFYDSSNGAYNPQFDVIGPVTLSKAYSYYGKNDMNGSDMNPQLMTKEACELAVDSVDFANYDNNNDGYVDFVFVIYAGYGEADGGAASSSLGDHQKFSQL